MREIEEPGMTPQFLARAIRRMKLSFIEMVKIMGKRLLGAREKKSVVWDMLRLRYIKYPSRDD